MFLYRGAEPRIVWEAQNRINIRVDSPVDISKQLSRLDGITIDYTLGRSSGT